MFSSRLHWDLRPNRIAQALERIRGTGTIILDLTESNPTRAGLRYPEREILRALGDPRSLVYEPTPAGSAAAREAVAGYYAARGAEVDPQRIQLTASTSESYAWLFKLLANPGDEVLAPRPSYPLFDFLAQMEAVRVVQYPLVYDEGWSIDLDVLGRCVTDRARAIVLVNPNNPTGSFVKRGEVETLVTVCREHNLALISDEVFSDYTLGPDLERVSSLTEIEEVLTFCLSGLSKIAGLPQMKLGWIAIGGPAALRRDAAARLEVVADTYLSVGTPVQNALPHLLEAGSEVQRQIIDRVHENFAKLQTSIGPNSGGQLLRVEGGWYATLRVPRTRSEEEWCLELLERDSVLVQPGYFYDFESEAYLILSLLTPPEIFQQGVQRIVVRL